MGNTVKYNWQRCSLASICLAQKPIRFPPITLNLFCYCHTDQISNVIESFGTCGVYTPHLTMRRTNPQQALVAHPFRWTAVVCGIVTYFPHRLFTEESYAQGYPLSNPRHVRREGKRVYFRLSLSTIPYVSSKAYNQTSGFYPINLLGSLDNPPPSCKLASAFPIYCVGV